MIFFGYSHQISIMPHILYANKLTLLLNMTATNERKCSGNGFINSDGLCTCLDDFYGYNCQYKPCPFAPAWIAIPKQSHVRNNPLVECSNMGTCDMTEGKCNCRDGYEGRACERLACPKSLAINIVLQSIETTQIQTCSGHGLCMSIRQAGEKFDGVALDHAPVSYGLWDSDKIQGCVCDDGWEGYDCSNRRCPWGRDPLEALNGAVSSEETFVVECQASGGYFSILILGKYTQPIPFDADPTLLQHLIHDITLSLHEPSTVTISMQTDEYGLPR